jgi:hypothetical protein
MKRFWLVLLSLGLVMAFSASAFAVDVKFSGSYYAAGMYQDRTNVIKQDGSDGPSTAFYFQRLRLQTDFIVSPGLSLITRFDALERAWGAPRATANRGYSTASGDINSAGTSAENENIAFDWAYIQYFSPIGLFKVGYMEDGVWGTPFGDSGTPVGKVQYIGKFGPVIAGAYLGKYKDGSSTLLASSNAADRDVDLYCAFGLVNFTHGSAGLLYKGYRVAATRATSALDSRGFEQIMHFLLPYAVVQIGPVKVQAEVIYGFGDYKKYDDGTGNVKLDDLAAYIDATVDLGIVYFGGTAAYVAGDDINTTDKVEGNAVTGGTDWNPTLILFNTDRYYWAGPITGYNNTQNPNNSNQVLGTNAAGMTNAWFFQGRVGVRPVAPLDIVASVSYAQAVQKQAYGIYSIGTAGVLYPTNSDSYGWEVDITGTYKITNNLSYMLGVGYLFTGDYFKGTQNNQIRDDYLIINKLTLTF